MKFTIQCIMEIKEKLWMHLTVWNHASQRLQEKMSRFQYHASSKVGHTSSLCLHPFTTLWYKKEQPNQTNPKPKPKKQTKLNQNKEPKHHSLPCPVKAVNIKPSSHLQSANHQSLVFMLPRSCSTTYNDINLYSYSHALLSTEIIISCKIYENHPLCSCTPSVIIPWWCHDDVIY